MNAASRLVHQGAVTRHIYMIYSTLLSKGQAAVVILSILVVLSGLATIYVTHLNRVLHANYQHNVSDLNRLQIKHGQLLLERSTWMMQARIQRVAETNLSMVLPKQQSVVVIRE